MWLEGHEERWGAGRMESGSWLWCGEAGQGREASREQGVPQQVPAPGGGE